MNKIISLIFALILTSLIANTLYLFDSTPKDQAIIARVIDGDTLELEDNTHVRLLNINSPEKSNPLYKQAFSYLKKFEGTPVVIETVGEDKYGRKLSRIYSNKTYINLESIRLGLSSKFLVQEDELSKFSKSESEAINNGLGIWEHSAYFDCIYSEIKPNEEIVILKSNCGQINLSNFTLKDESRKEYKFSPINLSEKPITLYSSSGTDSLNYIYWNSTENIWNNDRDTLYLFDNFGKIVESNSYGY